MSKLTIHLSSTALGTSACIKRFHYTVIEGYKQPAMSAKIIYGIAVHKFVDHMYKTGDMREGFVRALKAFSLPKIDDKKSPHLSDPRHMTNTCFGFWTSFVQEDNNFDVLKDDQGNALTEQTFSIKFYEDDYIIVFLEGTLDKLGQFRGGCFAIGDLKTTSTWDKADYFKQYELSRQLRQYTLALKLMHEKEPNGILGKIGGGRIGVFIDAIFLKPNANDNEIKRSTVFQIPDKEIEDYRVMLIRKCQELSMWLRSYKDRESLIPKEGILNGSCITRSGLCPFFNCCASPDNVAALLLKRDFVKVVFNPLDYNDLDTINSI